MQSTQSTSVVRLLTKGADSHILGVAATNTDNGLVESLTVRTDNPRGGTLLLYAITLSDMFEAY